MTKDEALTFSKTKDLFDQSGLTKDQSDQSDLTIISLTNQI